MTKVAVVTGAAGGMGRAIVARLLADGMAVVGFDVDEAGLAEMAQDGFARALRPIHTPFDGDTVFAMSTGAVTPEEDPGVSMAVLGTLAADCLVRAIEKAVSAAKAEA